MFHPRSQELRELLDEAGWLSPECGWLHPDIQPNGRNERGFKAMRAAGVKTVGIDNALNWLEEQDAEWFEKRPDDWIRRLYAYLEKNESKIERVKMLPLIRLKNGKHVCADKKLAFFLPDAEEEREGLKPFLNELPILQASLLDGDLHGKVKLFLKNLGVREMNPEDVISKCILPLYSQDRQGKPSIERNRLHILYLCEFWDELSGYEHRPLREKASETPILRAYRGVRPEAFDFVKPSVAYLPKAYTGDADLETYFSAYDGDVWFVDGSYMEDDSKRESWLPFLKNLGAIDTPHIINERINFTIDDFYNFSKKLANRSLKWEETNRPHEAYIADRDIRGLQAVLPHIKANKDINLARALWSLLIKASSRWNDYFQGAYRWRRPHGRSLSSKPFEAAFYRRLKETPWLPDEQGNFRRPSELFAPTSENRDLLGDSVDYLHPDFDVSKDNGLAEKLGAHLNAGTYRVLRYLEALSNKDAAESSVEKVEPIYRFLVDQDDPFLTDEFKEKPLVFISDPEPCWLKTEKAFWKDQRDVFGDHCGYLEKNYDPALKPFFEAMGVSDTASFSDYARVIRQIPDEKDAADGEVRSRVERLYLYIMPRLQDSQDGRSLGEEWGKTRNGKCWLGKKGDAWGFFSLKELVWEDDKHRSELFAGKVPFWAFNDGLLELAKLLGIMGCCQASVAKFDKVGRQAEDQEWSAEARRLYLYIHDFLKSPRYKAKKSAEFLERLLVWRAESIRVEYELNGVSVVDPNPRQSFLDENGRLWLGDAKESAYPDLIGDALQDYFGVGELREFVKDLLTSGGSYDDVRQQWVPRGFVPKCCSSSPDPMQKPDPEPKQDPVQKPDPTEKPAPILPNPPHVDRPSGGGTGPGNGQSHPHPGGGGSGGGGGGEREDHRKLKNFLADNPSLLGPGLERVKVEYEFGSGDRVDILLKDSSGNPVTVEVEANSIPSVIHHGMWQAVKYKHLAAVQSGRVCGDVRSILAAPSIPDYVKRECAQYGIEPFEIPEAIIKEVIG